jgi:hypothetical protein
MWNWGFVNEMLKFKKQQTADFQAANAQIRSDIMS